MELGLYSDEEQGGRERGHMISTQQTFPSLVPELNLCGCVMKSVHHVSW